MITRIAISVIMKLIMINRMGMRLAIIVAVILVL